MKMCFRSDQQELPTDPLEGQLAATILRLLGELHGVNWAAGLPMPRTGQRQAVEGPPKVGLRVGAEGKLETLAVAWSDGASAATPALSELPSPTSPRPAYKTASLLARSIVWFAPSA